MCMAEVVAGATYEKLPSEEAEGRATCRQIRCQVNGCSVSGCYCTSCSRRPFLEGSTYLPSILKLTLLKSSIPPFAGTLDRP